MDDDDDLSELLDQSTLGSPAARFIRSPVGQAIAAGAFPVMRNGQIEAAAGPFKAAYFLSDDEGKAYLIHYWPGVFAEMSPDDLDEAPSSPDSQERPE